MTLNTLYDCQANDPKIKAAPLIRSGIMLVSMLMAGTAAYTSLINNVNDLIDDNRELTQTVAKLQISSAEITVKLNEQSNTLDRILDALE